MLRATRSLCRWRRGDDGAGLGTATAAASPSDGGEGHDQLRRFFFSRKTATDDEVLRMADLVFEALYAEAAALADSPLAGPLVKRTVLAHANLSGALAASLSAQIDRGASPMWPAGDPAPASSSSASPAGALHGELAARLREPQIMRGVVCDIAKAVGSDPAVEGLVQPVFFFKGLRAVTTQRCAHALWAEGGAAGRLVALHLQARASELWAVDIHPAARLGHGLHLDHGTGVVVGETSVVGDDVSVRHGVTLGATGRPMDGARRHPRVESGVTLGAACTVLGPVTIGQGANVGAQAVVTRDVPPLGTVIGVNQLLSRPASCSAAHDVFTWQNATGTGRGGESAAEAEPSAARCGRGAAGSLGGLGI